MIGPFARRETAAMRRRAERQIDVFIVPIRASGAGMWLRVPLGYRMKMIEEFLEVEVFALDEYNGRWPPILHLIYNGRICTPGRTLSYHNIADGSTLLLVVQER